MLATADGVLMQREEKHAKVRAVNPLWRARTRRWLYLLLLPSLWAAAYPAMIRHGYAACASCHVDPGGGGLLTPYGRAQAVLLVSVPRAGGDEEELGGRSGFLYGAVSLPEWLNLGFSFRGGGMLNAAGDAITVRPVQMTTDLRAAVKADRFEAVASVGYAVRMALGASITPWPDNNVVSREHWVGYRFLEDENLRVRAGRMNLPYGLRNVEHQTWVREATRTDINEQQQHGAAVAFGTEGLRAELMAILGNYQLRPDLYRERGYAGTLEWAPLPTAAIGVSSLITRAELDVQWRLPAFVRQAHGAFVRWAPEPRLVLLAEGSLLMQGSAEGPLPNSWVAMAQADWEPFRGLHFYVTAETLQEPNRARLGGWLSAALFFAPFGELRVDGLLRLLPTETGTTYATTLFAQLHLSL